MTIAGAEIWSRSFAARTPCVVPPEPLLGTITLGTRRAAPTNSIQSQHSVTQICEQLPVLRRHRVSPASRTRAHMLLARTLPPRISRRIQKTGRRSQSWVIQKVAPMLGSMQRARACPPRSYAGPRPVPLRRCPILRLCASRGYALLILPLCDPQAASPHRR